MTSDIYKRSLDYHRYPTPGKLAIIPTKPLADQSDLALAYSPGVASSSILIAEDPSEAANLTSRGNLIAVVTNGTAILGLGNLGPLAAKPVMEGKAVLFKKFAGIDVFDIEINESDPDKLIDIIASLEPTFGGINLEDIKAPECFYIEQKLAERLKIPVFHDDQHGTAIIVCAAILNSLTLVDKRIEDVKLVTSGAGAAAIACLDLLLAMGLNPQNVILTDRSGVIYEGREDNLEANKKRYAAQTPHRTLAEAVQGADIFLGLSSAKLLTGEMVVKMADKPIILALANPEPEILPDEVKKVRSDAIIATGRSDFPNQVNNVLCFPFIFRGALDVGATCINQEMKIACVQAIAKLAQAEYSDIVSSAYGGEVHLFGSDYIIPKPFDPRLFVEVAFVVAKAAMETGVATRPIEDMTAYRLKLEEFIYRSNMLMKPVFAQAKKELKRVAFAEGEETKVIQAAQTLIDEGMARPILIGRPEIIQKRIDKLGLRLKPEEDFELINPNWDARYNRYWRAYHRLTERQGVSPDMAQTLVRTNSTVIAAMALQLGDADSAICGPVGSYGSHLSHLKDILGLKPKCELLAAMSGVILESGPIFLCDTYVTPDPSASELAEMAILAAEQVRRFGLVPKVALLSHSSFGSASTKSALKMKQALLKILELQPDMEVEGEMHADMALNPDFRQRVFPNSKLKGRANLLIMPSLDAANIAFNLLKALGNSFSIGPILLGLNKPAHILTPSATVRGIVNLSALGLVDSQMSVEEMVQAG